MNSRPFLIIAFGLSFLARLVLILSLASGFSSIHFTQMTLFLITKLVGLFEATLSGRVLIMTRRLVQLSGMLPSGQF
jgi:hypothetical protein